MELNREDLRFAATMVLLVVAALIGIRATTHYIPEEYHVRRALSLTAGILTVEDRASNGCSSTPSYISKTHRRVLTHADSSCNQAITRFSRRLIRNRR